MEALQLSKELKVSSQQLQTPNGEPVLVGSTDIEVGYQGTQPILLQRRPASDSERRLNSNLPPQPLAVVPVVQELQCSTFTGRRLTTESNLTAGCVCTGPPELRPGEIRFNFTGAACGEERRLTAAAGRWTRTGGTVKSITGGTQERRLTSGVEEPVTKAVKFTAFGVDTGTVCQGETWNGGDYTLRKLYTTADATAGDASHWWYTVGHLLVPAGSE